MASTGVIVQLQHEQLAYFLQVSLGLIPWKSDITTKKINNIDILIRNELFYWTESPVILADSQWSQRGLFINHLFNTFVFLYQLYSINYPSLRDNNMLRRVLVAEVLYSAEELKRRWMEEKMAQRNDSLCQTEEGAEECLRTSEKRIKAKEKHTGKNSNS